MGGSTGDGDDGRAVRGVMGCGGVRGGRTAGAGRSWGDGAIKAARAHSETAAMQPHLVFHPHSPVPAPTFLAAIFDLHPWPTTGVSETVHRTCFAGSKNRGSSLARTSSFHQNLWQTHVVGARSRMAADEADELIAPMLFNVRPEHPLTFRAVEELPIKATPSTCLSGAVAFHVVGANHPPADDVVMSTGKAGCLFMRSFKSCTNNSSRSRSASTVLLVKARATERNALPLPKCGRLVLAVFALVCD